MFDDQRSDRAILWNDPEIGIEWPIAEVVLSRLVYFRLVARNPAAATTPQTFACCG